MPCTTPWAHMLTWSFYHSMPLTQSACRALVDGITARHGHLDILVNAIGGYAGGKPVWETDPKTYQLMLTLNLHAGFNLARTAVPAMLQQKSGAIVNIASKAALDHAAGAGAYAASKAAALALFDCLAQDVKSSRRAGQLRPAQHYRYRTESQSHANCRFFQMAKAGRDRAGHPVPVQPGSKVDPRSSDSGVWSELKNAGLEVSKELLTETSRNFSKPLFVLII